MARKHRSRGVPCISDLNEKVKSLENYLREKETNQDPHSFLGKPQPKPFDGCFLVSCNTIFLTKGYIAIILQLQIT